MNLDNFYYEENTDFNNNLKTENETEFYFNELPNPNTYEKCNPQELNYNIVNKIEGFKNKENVDVFGKNIPNWVEIVTFIFIGICGVIGLVYLVQYIDDKILNKEIDNHTFRNKNNNYTNNKYNKSKLF